MQCVILAGGLGARLSPVVGDLPKPMAPILGKPFLEYQLLTLKHLGISHFVVCAGYRAQMISDYFRDGSRWGIQISYSVEAVPLGTAGALKQAGPLLDEHFLALNGDTFLEIDLKRLMSLHRQERAAVTIAVVRIQGPKTAGNIALGPGGRITLFVENQGRLHRERHIWTNAGVYILERRILALISEGRPVSLERETFPLLVAGGERIFGFPVFGYFIDIGTPGNYGRFEQDLKEGRTHAYSE